MCFDNMIFTSRPYHLHTWRLILGILIVISAFILHGWLVALIGVIMALGAAFPQKGSCILTIYNDRLVIDYYQMFFKLKSNKSIVLEKNQTLHMNSLLK